MSPGDEPGLFYSPNNETDMNTSVPVIPAVRLDKTRPFSTCHGDRVPEDPMYRVAYFQGGKLGKNVISLPFDSEGELVEDDRKTAPWNGLNSEGKTTTYYPLWNDKMRQFLAAKQKKLAERQEEEDELVEDQGDPSATVDLVKWLKGEATYNWPELVVACKKKHGLNLNSKAQMVTDLVIDLNLVRENELAPNLAKLLPAQAA